MISVKPEATQTNYSPAPSQKGTGFLYSGFRGPTSATGRSIRPLLLSLLLVLAFVPEVFGQTAGDFRTAGNVNFVAATHWERYDGPGPGWVDAGVAPVLADGVITIRNGHIASITNNHALDQLEVEVAGTINVGPGNTLTVNNTPGIQLDVEGTVNNSGTISPNGEIRFQGTGEYNHTRNGGTIPDASWSVSSDCNITGITDVSVSTTGFDQIFGNFTWNCTGQTGPTDAGFYLESNMVIAGDFSVIHTGLPFDPSDQALGMSNTATGYTITVGGDFLIESMATFKMNNADGPCFLFVNGDLTVNNGNLTISTGPANSTMSVNGDVFVNGGTIIVLEDNNTPAVSGTLNVEGDFSLNGGTLLENGNGTSTIDFSGGTTQVFSNIGGTFTNAIDFAVTNGGILDMGTSIIEGNGTFTLSSNAGLITAHDEGISTTAGTGSIQLTGSKTFDADADYTYNGSNAQVTGNALPLSIRNLTIDNASIGGVSLTNSLEVNDTLSLTDGILDLGTESLGIVSGGSLVGGSASSYVNAESSGTMSQMVAEADILFPVGTSGSYIPITLNNSGGTADYYEVRVFSDVRVDGETGASVAEINDCVNATWVVTEVAAWGSNLTVTPQWNGSNEGSSFDGSDCGVGYHDGSDWSPETTFGAAAGVDPYTRTRSGILGVGSFAVGESCTRMYDGTLPTASNPAPINVECASAVPAPDITVVSDMADNCTANPVVAFVSDVSDNNTCPEVITRTYSVSDDCNNQILVTQTITINDVTDPTFTVPDNDTICRSLDCTYDLDPSLTDDVIDEWDNCTMPIEATYSDDFTNLVTCDAAGYVIRTWTLEDACGNSTDQQQIIWVEPVPRVVPIVSDTIQCDSATSNIQLTSPSAFTNGVITFDYTVTETGFVTGYASPVSGLPLNHVIADQLVNTSNTVQTVTYNITPISPTACPPGAPLAVTIYVNPTPDFNVNSTDTLVCSGTNMLMDVSESIGDVEGALVYNLTRTYDPVDVSVVTGQPDGEYNLELDDINDQLINNTSQVQPITYHFEARIRDDRSGTNFGYCDHGIDTTIVVWINPTPDIGVVAPDTVICNSDTANITVTNPNAPIIGTWLYDLEVYADPAIGGESLSQTGITTPSFEENLTNTDTVVHKVEYIFIPRITPPGGRNDCGDDLDTTITIWVNPTPEIRVSTDTVLCNGETAAFTIRNPNVFLNGFYEYDLVVTPDSPAIEGERLGENNLTLTSFDETLTNTDTVVHYVDYHFTPRITTLDGGNDCENGLDATIRVWVNPTPAIRVVAEDSVLCNGETTNIMIRNPNSFINGFWEYNLQVIPGPGITGNSAGGMGLTDATIYDPLFNSDTVVRSVQYVFTPVKTPDPDVCAAGNDTTIVIWVNPIPRLLIDFSDSIFCSNDTITVLVEDGLGFVYGDTEYDLMVLYNTAFISGSRANNSTELREPGVPIVDVFQNLTNEAQPVFYIFRPRIIPADGDQNCEVPDIVFRVYINPIPEVDVDVPDDIICDGNIFEINVSSQNGDIREGTVVYDLDVTYNPAFVAPGGITADGEYLPSQEITDTLINHSVTVQVITYRLTARIRDERPDHGGEFCDNGSDTVITVLLNPTPRLDYTLMEDSLCYDDGFTILTDSAVSATHQLFYELGVVNDNSLTGVTAPSNYPVSGHLDQENVRNPHLGYGRLEYNIRPYISSEGCYGTDTTFYIDINPEPGMAAQLATPTDTAVCFDQGYNILMSTDVVSWTGNYVYDLFTYGYNEPMVENERTTGPSYVIENLDQTNVRNIGEVIEDVTYRYIPVIRNVNGAGKNCFGTSYDSITVQVAPELRGVMTPDTTFVGDLEIRCNGLEDAMLHPNVRGGYYRDDYTFDWETDGAFSGRLEDADSTQNNLGAGTYWYEVVDVLGCYHSDTIVLDQPPVIDVPYTVVDATCAATYRDDGSIDISPTGGTLGYSYDWVGPFGFNSDQDDVVAAISGPYLFTMLDTNRCDYYDTIWVEAAQDIVVAADPTPYGNYEITCNGENTGQIVINSIAGGFPDYKLRIYDELAGDTIHYEDVTAAGTTVSGLGAGRYTVIALDQVNCFSLNLGEYLTYELDEPDTISISRPEWSVQVHHDTVDVSCFGADDGFIDIEVTGGHTADNANTFNWSGIPADPDLVAGDSIQASPGNGYLSGGTYNVHVTDFWGCEQTAEFTLYEPSKMVLAVDSVMTRNGWNISCNGDNDGFIEISSSGGIMGHDYLWGPGAMTLPDPTSQDIYNLVADTFHLTITDSIGCTLDTVFEIRQPNELTVIEQIPRINEWEIACAGDSTGQITLTPWGGADSTANTYAWSTLDGYLADPASQDQNNLPEGTYDLLVTDIHACTYEMSYELLDPDPILIESLSADSAYCAGTASGSVHIVASGGVDPFVYLWNGPGAYTSNDPDSITDLYAGVYTLRLTDDNLCVKDSSIEVFEADHFDVVLTVDSDYHGAVISCNGYSDGVLSVTPLGGSLPYYYNWSNGATTPELSGLPEGTYGVVVNDQHGCTDSAQVTIDDPTAINFTMYTDDPACYGDSTGRMEFLVTGGTVFTVDDYQIWVNDRVNGTVVENLPAGIYQVKVMDLNECVDSTEAELIDNDPIVISSETEPAFCPDKADGQISLYVEGGTNLYDISWSQGLLPNEYYFNEVLPGNYEVRVTDDKECVMIDTVVVGYTFESCLVIPNAFSPNEDGYNEQWIIEGLELYPDPEIRVFNRWGSRVYYSPDPVSDPWDGTFNGRRLPIDSYHYIIDLNTDDDPPVTGNITIVR